MGKQADLCQRNLSLAQETICVSAAGHCCPEGYKLRMVFALKTVPGKDLLKDL